MILTHQLSIISAIVANTAWVIVSKGFWVVSPVLLLNQLAFASQNFFFCFCHQQLWLIVSATGQMPHLPLFCLLMITLTINYSCLLTFNLSFPLQASDTCLFFDFYFNPRFLWYLFWWKTDVFNFLNFISNTVRISTLLVSIIIDP